MGTPKSGLPELDIKIETMKVKATTRKLNVKWSPIVDVSYVNAPAIPLQMSRLAMQDPWLGTVLDMLEYMVWLDSGLIPMRNWKAPLRPTFDLLDPKEARQMKRRFRKAWRKLAKVRPQDFEQRMRTDNNPNDPYVLRSKHRHRRRGGMHSVCVGSEPKRAIGSERKRLVMKAAREKAYELHEHFERTLSVKPATSEVP